ncbi:ABC transporter ATP-binding protein [Paenibacillus sp. FSL R7-0331]|uniref:ABC transporter ATP-binding protein n=1 Tax=Paenibacillus sp. FSL R7-0331 TaxID=1536773 RepID=UPI00069401F1|nr:ABC transporter ATP-binding protein [Paenibacillus sp. FSL R7-0331]
MKKLQHNIRLKLHYIKAFKAELQPRRNELGMLAGCKILLLGLGLVSPLLFKLLIDRVIVQHEIKALWLICSGYVAVYVMQSIVTGGQTFVGNKFTNRVTFAIRTALWNRYLNIPLSTYSQLNTGDLKGRMDQDTDAVDRLFKVQIMEYGYSFAYLLAGAAMMAVFSWKLALVALLMVPVSFWITGKLGIRAREVSSSYRQIYGEYEGWLQQSIQSWREIKINRMEKRSSLKFTGYWHAMSKVFFQKEMYWFLNRVLQEFKDLFITRMNLYFLGGLLIFHGEMTIGGLLVFMKYYEMLFTQLRAINDFDMQFNGDVPGLEKISSMLAETPDTKNKTRVKPTADQNHLPVLQFKNVSFRYNDEGSAVLRDISFAVQPGARIALVGRSGSGKSTIIKLMLRICQPSHGNIQVGGRELQQIGEAELRKSFGVVMQNPAIFNMSILENVKLARPAASTAEIKEACRLAEMEEYIGKLTHGYDTVIGEKGVQLSGGQKQRLALARVLLSNAKIIILDEATSMLDHITEAAIHQTFAKLPSDRTVIIIAHRLSSVMYADEILLLDNGQIADQGKHQKLWLENTLYRLLFENGMGSSGPVVTANRT